MALSSSVSRTAVAVASRSGVIQELQKGTTEDQISKLRELHGTGTLPGRKLKEATMRKAPGEMDKAIKTFRRQGKEITVDTLCHEVKTIPGFLKMCEDVGLDLAWFENQARERMTANGL